MGFSVLLSVYKKEKPEYLQAALESIWNQTLQPDEIVLIQDGPLTAELERVIAEFEIQCGCLKIHAFLENVQLGRALAKGVELCSNELIARMDTDDIAVRDRFEKQYGYMTEHPEVAISGGWLEEFNDAGTHCKVKQMPEQNEDIYRYGRYRNPVNHMTVMFRKSAVLEVGNYRHCPLLEDYDLWIRMLAKEYRFYNMPMVLVRMRANEGLYVRRGGKAYYMQYKQLRRAQKEMGLLNTMEYLIALLITRIMILQPARVRALVYNKILRK